MNILIKLMSIVSLVIAPTLAQISNSKGADHTDTKAGKRMEMKVTSSNSYENDALKPVIAALQSDRLIDGKNFEIELDNGNLTINGQVQSKEVSNKYLPLFKSDKINIKVSEK
jgi:K(+)-stimulated pyrophosphate-energized sodium pump